MEEGLICLLWEFLGSSQNALVTRVQKSILNFEDDSTTWWYRKDTEFMGLIHCFANSTCCERSLKMCYLEWNVDPNFTEISLSRTEDQNFCP